MPKEPIIDFDGLIDSSEAEEGGLLNPSEGKDFSVFCTMYGIPDTSQIL
jgi:hypothetical protein